MKISLIAALALLSSLSPLSAKAADTEYADICKLVIEEQVLYGSGRTGRGETRNTATILTGMPREQMLAKARKIADQKIEANRVRKDMLVAGTSARLYCNFEQPLRAVNF